LGLHWSEMSVPFPGPSDNLRTHGVLSDSLRLTWSAPASAGAVPVLGYQVSAQAGGTSGFAVIVVDTGSAAPQAHVSGLHPGCWCVALTAHAHARTRMHPARTGCELGANASRAPATLRFVTAVYLPRTGTSSAWPRGRRVGLARRARPVHPCRWLAAQARPALSPPPPPPPSVG